MKRIINELPNIFNIAAYLIQENLQRGNTDKIAFYYQESTYTYGQVSNLVKRSAKLLSELGVKRENRVGILLNNRPEWIFYFLGAIWLGAIPVPINPNCSVKDVNYILQDSRSKVLLTSQEWPTKLDLVASDYLCHTLLVDGSESFISLLGKQGELSNYAPTSPDEPAFWLYTSGSTGRPKGVIHAHQSIPFCASQYGQSTLGLNATDITYSVANMAFAYGLGNSLYLPMAMGAASVISEANNVFDIIEDVKRYRPTVFFGIPSVYSSILELEEITSFDGSSVRLCVSAAEQLPKSIWQKWRDIYDLEICEGIGTTEFLHIFLSNQLGRSKPGSSGRPIPGYEIEIVNESGFPCSIGEIGELQVQGASLMLGYWNRLAETRQAIYGSHMKTGDRYRRDRDGFFWFMGRKDELFKVNGQWIYPLEIEGVLYQHPQVLEAAVISESSDGKHLTKIVAYISLKEGEEASPSLERSVYQFVKQHLPHFKAPKRIYFLAELPRTPTGKIHRQLLRNKPLDLPLAVVS